MSPALGEPLAGDGLSLEPLAERHREALRAACAEDPAIWPIYANDWGPAGFDANFAHVLDSPERLGFAVMKSDSLTGMSAYIARTPLGHTVEIGNTYLRPSVRGTGLNGRLKRLMIDRAFACGIVRVELRIDDRNARSKAATAKLATYEGVLRGERVTWTGHLRDTAIFSILRGEWQV